MPLDAATVALQWATGGLLFLWVTSRRREVGIGYGWLLRSVYAGIALVGIAAGVVFGVEPVREAAGAGVAVAAGVALVVSFRRRRAGVAGERARRARRRGRVQAMVRGEAMVRGTPRERGPAVGDDAAEFPPVLDLVAPLVGVVGLVAAAAASGAPLAVALARLLVGAVFLGAVSDAMLLGHWYLVQPGLDRGPLLELVRWTTRLWFAEVVVLVLPTGMLSALSGTVDDGWDGLLSWFWAASAVTTLGLTVVTRAALRERAYSAVMAATGLLYLAILTAFSTDLVARAVLAR